MQNVTHTKKGCNILFCQTKKNWQQKFLVKKSCRKKKKKNQIILVFGKKKTLYIYFFGNKIFCYFFLGHNHLAKHICKKKTLAKKMVKRYFNDGTVVAVKKNKKHI